MTQTGLLPRFVRDLLASPPKRGQGLNLWFYRVARLLHHFRDAAEIIELLKAATDGEPVKSGEIERAVERSKATAWAPGQPPRESAPAWPKVDKKARRQIAADGGGLVDLWENSPLRLDDNETHTEEFIDLLFPGDPLLCCGKSNSSFDTRTREEWRGELSGMQLIVPSPMTARVGPTKEKPPKMSAHALSITGPRRFLVIEQDADEIDEQAADEIDDRIDEQAAVLLHLATIGPLALAVHSGNKSIHGWFRCAGQTDEGLQLFMQYAVGLGADSALWTRSQFTRMPDGRRDNGSRQTVYFFNPRVLK
jgi:hypothetical protein